MSQTSPVALVTGANQGIGLQIVKDLVAQGFEVYLGARRLERGEAAAQAIGAGAHAIQLDVTDQASIAAAAERIRDEQGRLDVLINNAAISRPARAPDMDYAEYTAQSKASTVRLDDVRDVWETNVFGVLAVTQTMLPLLRATPGARIVNVSSGLGSLTVVSDPKQPLRSEYSPTYAASKTAMNAITVAFAIELEAEGIRVNAVTPGFVNTAINSHRGTETVESGAAEAVRLALLGSAAPTGGFTHATFGAIPW
ncbi:SDR family NAD(P)-dependent oxidoreductase [Caulobacter sp. KR2-114]|uniref:SDR family NAD(P)-dependent oxidoreductase n=1 Tax=Caulobacter sp. KR2-114 TaxID=3400912 RepID=UPI003C110457